MPTSGSGETSGGRPYDWSIVGYGRLRGGEPEDWTSYQAPDDATMAAHRADPNWGMVAQVRYADGSQKHMTIVGSYPPDDLPDIVDVLVEDYG